MELGVVERTYAKTHKRYANFRTAAHMRAMQYVSPSFPGLLLTNINEEALSAYRQQWSPTDRHPHCCHWDWGHIASSFNSNPKHFEMAVWNTGTTNDGVEYRSLHALVIGGTTRPKKTVQVSFLESFRWNNNPFTGSVFPIIEVALTYYAFLLGAEKIRIKDAFRDVVPYYKELGYRVENPGQNFVNLLKELRK